MAIETLSLGAVQETLLIPLLGRALETQRKNGILKDLKSLEIVANLNYDFTKFDNHVSRRSMLRTTVRTVIIDRIVNGFLKDHPSATIVELGCGLNTRFDRLDNGHVKWFDLDMPDVHEIWKNFFSENDRKHFLPVSAFDVFWMEKVAETRPTSILIISEASVIYFPEDKIKQLFIDLAHFFPNQFYLFDSATSAFIEELKKNDALQYLQAKFQWQLDNPGLLKKWVPTLEYLKTVDLEVPSKEFKDLYPTSLRILTSLSQLAGRAHPGQYQLNFIKL